MTDTDLFGAPVTPQTLKGKGRSGRGKQWGYYAPPGTGPAGETCGSCQHIVRARGGRYRKCGLARAIWTGGPKTDVLARAPACLKWAAVNKNSSTVMSSNVPGGTHPR